MKSYDRAMKGISGARKMTEEERDSVTTAEKNRTAANIAHADATFGHRLLTEEHEKNKLEVERLKAEKAKDTYFEASGRQKELDAAEARLAGSEIAHADAENKLAVATKAKANAEIAEVGVKSAVKTATSETSRKKEYQDRLENTWGRMPFGAAGKEAAKKHIKEEKDSQDLGKLLKKMAKEQYDAEQKIKGETAIPAAPAASVPPAH